MVTTAMLYLSWVLVVKRTEFPCCYSLVMFQAIVTIRFSLRGKRLSQGIESLWFSARWSEKEIIDTRWELPSQTFPKNFMCMIKKYPRESQFILKKYFVFLRFKMTQRYIYIFRGKSFLNCFFIKYQTGWSVFGADFTVSCGLVTFTEEIINGKLHFLWANCSSRHSLQTKKLSKKLNFYR